MRLRELLFGCVDLHAVAHAGVLEWRGDGFFRATACDGVTVRGVGSDAEAVAELLRRAEVLQAEGPVYRARPAHEVVDFGWTSEASAAATDLDVDFAHQLGDGRPASLMGRLQELGRAVPSNRVEREVLAQAGAIALNASAPQVGSHRLFMPPFDGSDVGALGVERSATRGWATWVQWVDPRLLTSTNAKVWGDIDRRPRRDTVVRVSEWLRDAAAEGQLDAWLSNMFAHDPMLLHRLEGPAGPVYEVLRGTHRAHAARIWDLPWVLARVQVERLAKPLRPRTPLMEALWESLSRRGLMSAENDGDCWYLHEAAAEWMLTPPAMAVQWNAMYERLYPGALQAFTGMSVGELFDADRWAAALLA
ncbi:hypothetical protein F0Q45_10985 [Mycobacterium simiae]|uniref:Uncharacterized protein n=1 Tax=Mycobacterium simiae TaxID=1784 RepID=A0A5B1BSZ7_MYCSI|nr:hypothetical protein [Mycobacterium simiae]KAA1250199.1 hypothetical protein F0Q45_10985 [Mycobacterium simiae]